MKNLILLTSEFPYGKAETFLENEFPLLNKAFSSIYIFTEKSNKSSRIKTEDASTFFMDKPGIIERLSSLFNCLFWNEILYLLKKKKLTRFTFRTAWYSFSKAITIKKSILHFQNTSELNESVLYSYWMDEKALALALLKNRFPNLICITRAHGWDVYHERHRENYLPFRSFILKKLNMTFTISQNGKDYLSTKYPKFNEKIIVSRLGTMPLSSIPKKKENNSFYVLSISSIIPLKRVGKILEVVSESTEKKIHWTHIGDGPLMGQVKSDAKKREHENPNFSFALIGQKTNEEVREFLSTNYVDLFINLSETEGIPVSIMEAQSASIPVFATSVGGVPEIVNEHNGFLVDTELSSINFISVILNESLTTRKRVQAFENWKINYNAIHNYNHFINQIKILVNT